MPIMKKTQQEIFFVKPFIVQEYYYKKVTDVLTDSHIVIQETFIE